MRQEEIVDEIRKKCGNAELWPDMCWHFFYNRHHYVCMPHEREGLLRFCIPHLANASEYDSRRLAKAMNETNRSVKFIKTMTLNCGSVSLSYDHKTTPNEATAAIVPHIINALDFASTYLLGKLGEPR